MMTRAMRCRRGEQHGQTLVEFALVALFVLIPVIFGTIEIGRGVWYFNQLSQLAREGARWLVVVDQYNIEDKTFPGLTANGNAPITGANLYSPTSCATGCDKTTVQHVRNMAIGMADDLTVEITRPALPPGSYRHGMWVEVRVVYPYRPVVTGLLNIPAQFNLSARTRMDLE